LVSPYFDMDATAPWLKTLDDKTQIVSEGLAEILFEEDKVFYNPIQEFNRDMSVAAIKVWSQLYLEEKRKKMLKSDNPLNDVPLAEFVVAPASVPKNPLVQSLNEKQQARRNTQMHHLQQVVSAHGLSAIDLSHEAYGESSFTVLEALAASGLRSIRYAKEIPRIKNILVNDLSRDAVAAIARNAKHNKVDHILLPHEGDANQAFYQALAEKKRYDVVDLDPYGSAAPFLDAAVQVVADGGLLCVTCTDLAVLAGSQPESCFGKYGGLNVPNAPYTHELALRILLHSIQTTAAKYRRGIEVLMSCHIDYYVRVFVRVHHSAARMKEASSKTAMVVACQTCNTFNTQPLGKLITTDKGCKYGPAVMRMPSLCEICGSKTHIGGPFYCSPIHDRSFVARLIDHVVKHDQSYGTWDRMAGMLMVIYEELVDVPLYYVLPKLCNVLHCTTPPLETFV
ncbi:tRNA methyltransferase 1, partial [Kappamyces sp. JEL0680]